MSPRPILLFALLLPLAALAALAGPSAEPSPAQVQRRLARLDLSLEQALALAPLLDEAAALRQEQCVQVVELAPELADAWGDLREIVAVDGTPDPEVWRRAGALEREVKALREQLDEALITLEAEALPILEPWQQELMASRPRGERHGLDQRVRALADARHPRPGRLGQALQQPVVAQQLYLLAGLEPSTAWREAERACAAATLDRTELSALRNEISAWNLINGLHLQEEQVAAIVEAAAGDPAVAEAAVEAVLDPGQWEVLQGFSPCLLPARDLGNPVRAGQAGSGGAYEKWLERARLLEDQGQDQAVQRLLAREQQHLGPSPEGRAQQVRAILAEASAMDEVNYALAEPELLERLALPNELKEARAALLEARRADGGEGLVRRYLLSEAFVDVVDQRFTGRE